MRRMGKGLKSGEGGRKEALVWCRERFLLVSAPTGEKRCSTKGDRDLALDVTWGIGGLKKSTHPASGLTPEEDCFCFCFLKNHV